MALAKRSRILVVYTTMPLPSIASAIISSVINSIVESILEAPAQQPQPPMYAAIARNFPAGTLKGELQVPLQPGSVQIGDKILRAAPGLQIRNELNMIVLSGTLQRSAYVRYQLDPAGGVWRIWLLTAAEVAAADFPEPERKQLDPPPPPPPPPPQNPQTPPASDSVTNSALESTGSSSQ